MLGVALRHKLPTHRGIDVANVGFALDDLLHPHPRDAGWSKGRGTGRVAHLRELVVAPQNLESKIVLGVVQENAGQMLVHDADIISIEGGVEGGPAFKIGPPALFKISSML